MFRSFDVELLSVREYLGGARGERTRLIPPGPGIYIWTLDLGLLFADKPSHDAAGELLQKALTPVRWTDHAKVGHYRRVQVSDAPKEISHSGLRRLKDLREQSSDKLPWVLAAASVFQRPLYVGKALDLRKRLVTHLREGSPLYRRLTDNHVDPVDCQVTMLRLQVPEPEPGDADGPGAEELLEAEADDAETELSGATVEDIEEMDVPVPGTAGAEADNAIRLAESLVIRLAHPVLNKKMD